MKDTDATPPSPQPDTPPPARPPGLECIVGETLCRVRFLSEAQWDALPPGRRPAVAMHFPGKSWLVATLSQVD